jgi:hypothetical protein
MRMLKPENISRPSSKPSRDRTEPPNPSSQELILPPQHTVSPQNLLKTLTNFSVAPALSSAEEAISHEIASIQSLAEIASKSPYYKYAPREDLRTC